ncbi:tail fiber assembly protein [Citrobacter freundii]|uniref:tail fiber assembly protein n=1 Tax=Citrobacter freundii TaxID=546 RepID=UPI0023B267AF|nr:tail fiber assembly protein [Citrobacter freundii]MDE9603751.1 tail fiber assembly protein [Citrobacter freundii]
MYRFDAKKLAFFPVSLSALYTDFPYDGPEIDDTEFELFRNPPVGKILAADKAGNPVLVDITPPTADELAEIERRRAETLQRQLIDEATVVIAPLKDALDGGYIDDVDIPRLTAWQKYRYALTKVDLTNPVWPEKPV